MVSLFFILYSQNNYSAVLVSEVLAFAEWQDFLSADALEAQQDFFAEALEQSFLDALLVHSFLSHFLPSSQGDAEIVVNPTKLNNAIDNNNFFILIEV